MFPVDCRVWDAHPSQHGLSRRWYKREKPTGDPMGRNKDYQGFPQTERKDATARRKNHQTRTATLYPARAEHANLNYQTMLRM